MVFLALIAFLPTPSEGAVGALDCTPETRRSLAAKSRTWDCPQCSHTAQDMLQRAQQQDLAAHGVAEPPEITELVSKIEFGVRQSSSPSEAEDVEEQKG